MFKAIKNNKIIAISDTDSEFLCLVYDKVIKDTKHKVTDYTKYQSEYILNKDVPAMDKETARQLREEAYTKEIDPITAHIQRLLDDQITPEIIEKIAELRKERKNKIEEIKAKYPYPEE